jgi:uncharacterized protein
LRRVEAGPGRLLVEGITSAGWKIAGTLMPPPLLLANGAVTQVASTDAMGLLDAVLTLEPRPEVLLFGTGDRLVWPSVALRRRAAEAGIALEAMDSRAAARTWNLLVQEGRAVAALLS